jgi:hypothetical protein
MERLFTRLGEPIALAVLGAVHMGLLSSLAGLAPTPLIPVGAGAGVLAVAVAVGWRGARDVRSMGRRDIALAATAGALSGVVVPWLVALNRYTDAPPGTELIFFAWALWGALAILAAAATLLKRLPALAGVVAIGVSAVTGAAAVLASWERPSSFSPFVRYVTEESWMLVAGVCFLGGGLVLARLMRAHGRARPLLVGGVGAAFAAAVIAVASGEGRLLLALTEYSGSLVTWAAAWAIVWLLFATMLSGDRAAEAGVAMTCAPVLLTGLLAIEAFTGVAGPNPIIWGGVAGGALLLGAAVAGLAGREEPQPPGGRRWRAPAVAAAAVPLAVALVGLALPALGGSAWADRKGAAFQVAWTLSGWESIAAWIVVASAMLAFASVLRRSPMLASAALAAAAAYPLLASTPYRVLTRWLPTDVAADLGTEYAWIHFDALPGWPAWAALAGAVACAALVLTGPLIARRARDQPGRRETEETQ